MTEPGNAIVQMLDGEAWEAGEIAVVGRPVTAREWLATLDEWGMRLSLPPLSRITGGSYDGGHVLTATGDARLYFAVPATALVLLTGRLSEADGRELLRRIGR